MSKILPLEAYDGFPLACETPSSAFHIWEFPKIRGTLFWGPYIGVQGLGFLGFRVDGSKFRDRLSSLGFGV